MAGSSTYLADLILNFWLRAGTWPAKPGTIYLSLHTGDPGETGANEVLATGTGYARVAVSVVDASWDAPAVAAGGRRRSANAAPRTFPNPIANWGTITHVGFWDLGTVGTGNFIWGDPLGITRAVNAGDVAPSFAVGVLGVAIA